MPSLEQKSMPSDEQIREFWEWCGFRYVEPKYCESCTRQEPPYLLKAGIGRRIDRSELLLDLNNLFLYAVPKLSQKYNNGLEIEILTPIKLKTTQEDFWVVTITSRRKEVSGGSSFDPALALFWAIYEVIHGS